VAAEREYKILKELNPKTGFQGLLISMGRFEDALISSEYQLETDPLSPWAWGFKILSLYYTDQPMLALEAINDALSLNDLVSDQTGLHFLYDCIGRVYLYQEMFKEVVGLYERYLNTNIEPLAWAPLAISYFQLNETDKFHDLLKELQVQSSLSTRGSPSNQLAQIYTNIGEIETAFEWLKKSYQDREVRMNGLKHELIFEPLYNDPRWQEMLDKVGFPE